MTPHEEMVEAACALHEATLLDLCDCGELPRWGLVVARGLPTSILPAHARRGMVTKLGDLALLAPLSSLAPVLEMLDARLPSYVSEPAPEGGFWIVAHVEGESTMVGSRHAVVLAKGGVS